MVGDAGIELATPPVCRSGDRTAIHGHFARLESRRRPGGRRRAPCLRRFLPLGGRVSSRPAPPHSQRLQQSRRGSRRGRLAGNTNRPCGDEPCKSSCSGPGVQGTLFAVRLSLGGHEVSLVARGSRAAQLARCGAIIEDIRSGRRWRAELPVSEKLEPDCAAELCLVTVRREQLESVLPSG